MSRLTAKKAPAQRLPLATAAPLGADDLGGLLPWSKKPETSKELRSKLRVANKEIAELTKLVKRRTEERVATAIERNELEQEVIALRAVVALGIKSSLPKKR